MDSGEWDQAGLGGVTLPLLNHLHGLWPTTGFYNALHSRHLPLRCSLTHTIPLEEGRAGDIVAFFNR